MTVKRIELRIENDKEWGETENDIQRILNANGYHIQDEDIIGVVDFTDDLK